MFNLHLTFRPIFARFAGVNIVIVPLSSRQIWPHLRESGAKTWGKCVSNFTFSVHMGFQFSILLGSFTFLVLLEPLWEIAQKNAVPPETGISPFQVCGSRGGRIRILQSFAACCCLTEQVRFVILILIFFFTENVRSIYPHKIF